MSSFEERVNRRIGKNSKKERIEPNYATKEDINNLRMEIASGTSSNEAIAREQIKAIKRQQRKERVDGMIKVFRRTTEKIAPTPISPRDNHELFFGSKSLRNMTRRRKNV